MGKLVSMSDNSEDYLRVMQEWSDATIEVKDKFELLRRDLTNEMGRRMHAGGKDPSDIAFETMDKMRALDEDERNERNDVDRDFRTMLDTMRGDG